MHPRYCFSHTNNSTSTESIHERLQRINFNQAYYLSSTYSDLVDLPAIQAAINCCSIDFSWGSTLYVDCYAHSVLFLTILIRAKNPLKWTRKNFCIRKQPRAFAFAELPPNAANRWLQVEENSGRCRHHFQNSERPYSHQFATRSASRRELFYIVWYKSQRSQ